MTPLNSDHVMLQVMCDCVMQQLPCTCGLTHPGQMMMSNSYSDMDMMTTGNYGMSELNGGQTGAVPGSSGPG